MSKSYETKLYSTAYIEYLNSQISQLVDDKKHYADDILFLGEYIQKEQVEGYWGSRYVDIAVAQMKELKKYKEKFGELL